MQSRGYGPVTLEASLKLRSVYVKRAKILRSRWIVQQPLRYHDRLDKGITRCSTLLPTRGSAGMPSSLSGYLPLTGKDQPAISRLNLSELSLKPAIYRYRDPNYKEALTELQRGPLKCS